MISFLNFVPDHLSAVRDGMTKLARVEKVEDAVLVTTHCMYPSNGLVKVTVRGGIDTIVASDEGGALGEALSAGIEVRNYDRTLNHLIKDHGLKIQNGVIYTPRMPLAAAPLAVLHVANASQEAARWMFDNVKIKRTRDFKAMLASFLKTRFEERVHHETLVGSSNKPHKFANVVDLGQARKLIIDPVSNEASSINARVVANMDLKATGNPNIIQRIVYDDEDDWSPSDLNLLEAGATTVPFSSVGTVIERLAHAA